LNNVKIQWKHNGTVVVADKFHYEISEYDRRLVVKNPNPNKDGGVYACETRVQFATLGGSRVEQARAQVYGELFIQIFGGAMHAWLLN